MGKYSAYVKRVKEAHLTCVVCGESFFGATPNRCCDGTDCDCRGEPISPIVCSLECAEKYDYEENTTKQTTDE